PIMDKPESEEYALKLLSVENPSIILSIERCSAAQDDKYRNMRDLDITDSTARIDLLFNKHETTIGIGDGGNEIGMGNVLDGVDKSEKLVSYPAISTVNELIISSVSNWGGYGLLSSLSMSTGENVLPTVDEDMQIIRRMVDMGAVDGFSGEQTYKVDGFSLEENAHVLQRLHDILD
ncbi:MAG: glutamate cyclase domain-containing protein, partial [Chloroflexota bacterium]|nr:glutamate cyclase domain-containing protein [Chloroflexota bacterium]